MTYRILDTQTNQPVGGLYTSRRRADAKAERLDQAYGAYRYIVTFVA